MRTALLKTEPMDHQVQAIAFATKNLRSALWLDIGLGKTLAAIYSAVLLEAKSVLVVCPNSVRRTWCEEIEKHTNLTYREFIGEPGERKAALYSSADFYIINYEGLRSLWAEKVTVSRGKNRGKGRYVPLKQFSALPFDCLVIDECHGLSDPYSLQTQICYRLSRMCKYVMLLTGTPDTGKLKGLWSQYWVLDSGESLGKSYQGYLYQYFKSFTISTSRVSFKEWIPKQGSLDLVMERVSPRTIRIDRRDCFDLPPVVFQQKTVPIPLEQKEIQKALVSGLRSEIQRVGIKPEHVQNKSIKLMQLTGGFILEGNVPRYMKLNPKLDLLYEVLQETSSKVIVYHAFVEEGRMIERFLSKKKVKFSSLRGEIDDKTSEYQRFKSDPEVNVLIAHPRSAGVGLNLQEANVVVFYSSAMMSSTTRKQAIGRVDRVGQTSSCSVVDLVMTGSVDEVILNSLERNLDLAQQILDWLRNS